MLRCARCSCIIILIYSGISEEQPFLSEAPNLSLLSLLSAHNIIFAIGSIAYVLKHCTQLKLNIAAYKKEAAEERHGKNKTATLRKALLYNKTDIFQAYQRSSLFCRRPPTCRQTASTFGAAWATRASLRPHPAVCWTTTSRCQPH